MSLLHRRALLALLGGAPLAPDRALAEAAPPVESFEALRALTGGSDEALLLLGHSTSGDGGGGLFIREPRGARADDDGVTVAADASGRRWRRLFTGPIDVRWAGARCDGATDDTAAIARASKAGPIVIAAGECLISAELIVASPCEIAAGAAIRVVAGASVTFARGFDAPIAHVFTGTGSVRFDPRFTPEGHPEWWGAAANDPAAGVQIANAAAIQAAVDALRTTRLSAGIYYIDTTLYMRVRGARLIGTGVTWAPGDPAASVIAYTLGTGDIIQVGPQRQPASFGAFLRDCHVEALTVWRTLAPVADAPSGPGQGYFNSPSGFRVQWTQNTVFRDLCSIDSCHGYYVKGNNNFYGKYCTHNRTLVGPSPTSDFNHCVFQDNSISYGFDSGNASIYFENFTAVGFSASVGNHGREWTGHYTFGGFTDTFITRLETANHEFGIQANGAGQDDTTYSAEDLHILDCVLDGCEGAGIQINGANGGGQVTIVGCYIAGAGPGHGISVVNSAAGGLVTIMGCQLISGPGSTGVGIKVSGALGALARGVISDGNIITDWYAPEVYSYAANCRSRNGVNAWKRTPHEAAIYITGAGSGRHVIEPLIQAADGVALIPIGVKIDVGADHLEIRCTGIDPAALAGAGGVNKVVYDGTRITTADGAFASHSIVRGIMD